MRVPYRISKALFHATGSRMSLNVRTKPSSKSRWASNCFMAPKYLRVVHRDHLKDAASSAVAAEHLAFSPASVEHWTIVATDPPYVERATS